MKKAILFLLIVLTIFMFSCTRATSIKSITSKSRFIPLNDSVLYAKFETSNGEYKLFLAELKKTDITEWRKCLYDSTLWVSQIQEGYNEPMKRTYHWSYAYADHPVLNIPKYGAIKYCEWLTSKVKDSNKQFRIPSFEEASALLETADLDRIGRDTIDGTSKAFYANLRYVLQGRNVYSPDGALYTAPVSNYIQTKDKAASIIGNVLAYNSSDYLIGGGWFSFPSEVLDTISLPTPNVQVGMRVFLEVSRKKRNSRK